jgi:hypothetical protein
LKRTTVIASHPDKNFFLPRAIADEVPALRVSASEHADLYWGVRGSAGNFGIVT